MFNKIFIENEARDSLYTTQIIKRFPKAQLEYIDSIDNIWGRVKKPYLQKRDNLNLFIGNKKGAAVKLAPDAYGLGTNVKHYYYVHAFNCIYECQYCYLQGYFNTPDMVFYVNHHDIIAQMQTIMDETQEEVWFHAGEYSDSLALSHITGELPVYWEFFKKNSRAKLELRTKSVSIRSLEALPPLKNIVVSFSLAGHDNAKKFDYKCPSVEARLKAIEKVAIKGFNIGIHFDPIVYTDNIESDYEEVIKELTQILPENQIAYISIGIVRFTKDVYKEVQKNYPDSPFLAQDFSKSFDGKIRYPRPLRMWPMLKVKQLCLDYGVASSKIYLCMEDEESSQ